MGESFIQLAADGAGKMTRTRNRTVGANSIHEQYVIVQDEAVISNKGRAGTYRQLGVATATTQNLMTVWNGSTNAGLIVRVNRIMLDTYSTVPRLASIAPPIVRVSRVTAAPTGGTAMVKSQRDTAGTADTGVALLQGTASDGGAATAITAAVTAGSFLTQEACARSVSATSGTPTTTQPWFEPADRMEFFAGEPDIILRQNQGIVLYLVGAAGVMMATDHFIAALDWDEYTLP